MLYPKGQYIHYWSSSTNCNFFDFLCVPLQQVSFYWATSINSLQALGNTAAAMSFPILIFYTNTATFLLKMDLTWGRTFLVETFAFKIKEESGGREPRETNRSSANKMYLGFARSGWSTLRILHKSTVIISDRFWVEASQLKSLCCSHFSSLPSSSELCQPAATTCVNLSLSICLCHPLHETCALFSEKLFIL